MDYKYKFTNIKPSDRVEEFLIDFNVGLMNLYIVYYAARIGDRELFDKCASRIERLASKYEKTK